MKIDYPIRIALNSLKRNKGRSLLTMLGVIIGVFSVILLISIGNGLKSFVVQQLQDLGSNLILVFPGKIDFKKGGFGGEGHTMALQFSNSKLKEEDAKKITSEVSLAKNVVSMIEYAGVVTYKNEELSTSVNGVTDNFFLVGKRELSEGRFFSKADILASKKVIILGGKIAEDLFGNFSPIGKKVKVDEIYYTVIGVLKKQGALGSASFDGQTFIPLPALKNQFNKENLSFIYVEVVSNEAVPEAIPQIEKAMKRRLGEDDFTVIDQKEFLDVVSSILGTMTIALSGIAAISLLVGGVGIMNIMLVSVAERIKEIGLRKAVGATPKIILTQFLLESVFLSVGGGALGILSGGLVSLALNKFLPVAITLSTIVLAFGVSAAIGIIFGIFPAKKAAKLSPIEALRYE